MSTDNAGAVASGADRTTDLDERRLQRVTAWLEWAASRPDYPPVDDTARVLNRKVDQVAEDVASLLSEVLRRRALAGEAVPLGEADAWWLGQPLLAAAVEALWSAGDAAARVLSPDDPQYAQLRTAAIAATRETIEAYTVPTGFAMEGVKTRAFVGKCGIGHRFTLVLDSHEAITVACPVCTTNEVMAPPTDTAVLTEMKQLGPLQATSAQLVEVLGWSILASGDYSFFLARCRVCGETRHTRFVSVAHRVTEVGEPPRELPFNVAYCNDRPACIEAACAEGPWFDRPPVGEAAAAGRGEPATPTGANDDAG